MFEILLEILMVIALIMVLLLVALFIYAFYIDIKNINKQWIFNEETQEWEFR